MRRAQTQIWTKSLSFNSKYTPKWLQFLVNHILPWCVNCQRVCVYHQASASQQITGYQVIRSHLHKTNVVSVCGSPLSGSVSDLEMRLCGTFWTILNLECCLVLEPFFLAWINFMKSSIQQRYNQLLLDPEESGHGPSRSTHREGWSQWFYFGPFPNILKWELGFHEHWSTPTLLLMGKGGADQHNMGQILGKKAGVSDWCLLLRLEED